MRPEAMFEAVQEISHEQFPPNTWLRWFNEGLQDLAPALKLETYEEFTITNAKERDLPGDILEIVKFKLEKNNETTDLEPVGTGEDAGSGSYWIWDDKVHFPENETGTLKLWYYRRPAKFALGSNRPDIQEGYEDAVILYAAAKSKAPDRWLTDKDDFYRDYLVRKHQIELERNRQLRRPRRAKVPPFTAGGRFR